MAESSLRQAVTAVGACLIHIQRIVDSLKPSASWQIGETPNPEKVKRTVEENWVPLCNSFSQLEACYSDARTELIAARTKMLNSGVSVRQGLATAFGVSNVFYLGCAYDSIKTAVKRVEDATGYPDESLPICLGRIEDPFGAVGTDSLRLLEQEWRDAAGVLGRVGDNTAAALTAPESEKATSIPHKTHINRGGRQPKLDDLWEVVKEQDAMTPKPKDAKIAGVYNRKYGSQIGDGPGKRKKATARDVANVRYERTKRKRT